MSEATTQHSNGDLSLSLYLGLVERCEDLARAWIDAVQDYRLATIDLDHATGRLNRPREGTPVP